MKNRKENYLQVRTVACRQLTRYESQGGRYSGPESRYGDEYAVPGDLETGRYDVLGVVHLQEGPVVGKGEVQEVPLGYGLEYVGLEGGRAQKTEDDQTPRCSGTKTGFFSLKIRLRVSHPLKSSQLNNG